MSVYAHFAHDINDTLHAKSAHEYKYNYPHHSKSHMTVHVYTSTLTIRDFPHEGCIGVDIDAALLGNRVFVGRRGKTKVTNLDVTRRVEKDVPRFQVTVDHTLLRQREDLNVP